VGLVPDRLGVFNGCHVPIRPLRVLVCNKLCPLGDLLYVLLLVILLPL